MANDIISLSSGGILRVRLSSGLSPAVVGVKVAASSMRLGAGTSVINSSERSEGDWGPNPPSPTERPCGMGIWGDQPWTPARLGGGSQAANLAPSGLVGIYWK